MSIPPFEELPEDGGGGGGFDPGEYPDALPGLEGNLRTRYTFNGVVNEQMPAVDFLGEVVFPTARMFVTHGANGKLRMHNKKPVDFCYGLTAFTIGQTVLQADDVSPWVANDGNYLLIDPHTNKSEVRTLISAEYDADQNDVTLTTNEATDVVITGFSGCDGASTPATATIEIAAATNGTPYTVTLDGYEIPYTPTTADTPETVASFLAGTFAGHPKLNRRFRFEVLADTVTITGLFGNLEVDVPLEKAHSAPVADPTVAPVLNGINPGPLDSGPYRVAYTYKDEDGNQTLLSPYFEGTIAANWDIEVAAVTPPSGCTVCWYISPAPYSDKIRFHSENDGSSFIFGSLPKLDDPVHPDVNRTGTEMMRVMAVFSDREESRSGTSRSNVLRASYEWSLSDQKKRHNRIDLAYRDASDDYRRIELRVHDKQHQAKIRKVEKKEINGYGIDNFFQAQRIAFGLLAENRDANFRYKWTATREALLLEEFDVVAITDAGSGVFNLPVSIESRQYSLSKAGLPTVTFTAPIFANTLYDDSIVERTIPVIAEEAADAGRTPTDILIIGNTGVSFIGGGGKARINWNNTDGNTGTSTTTFGEATITVA